MKLESDEQFRDQAVANVDQRYGFTSEFAPDPKAHRMEYLDEEEKLRRQALREYQSERLKVADILRYGD